ncbi:DUF6544 family protein [Paenibacillus senegalensis]|uniref:DUF6544 family protein n=1 Tax=Paenibacillus senegalensis TaxID=1465766 RepID=UPI00028871B5|nr:DUF6544 family protein [Paenibacillus senegalensis]
MLIITIFTGIAILAVILAAAASYRSFQRRMKEETARLAQDIFCEEVTQVSEEQLRQLPQPVSRWLRHTRFMERKVRIGSVTISQEGMLRTKPEGKWMPFRAKQHSLPHMPSFIWMAIIQAAPGIPIYGRDLYWKGQADMLVKLMGVFKVGHAYGPEINQGSLVRYLAEIVWYPPAALSPHITWEALDDNAARAIISYGGITASGIFEFQNTGLPVRFVAQRYKDAGGGPCTLEEWSVRMDAYKQFAGILIPTQGEVSWNLRTGPFPWLRFEVKEVRFDQSLDL